MTKGGDKDVTTRNTDRALVDSPDTTISPPGLHGKLSEDGEEQDLWDSRRMLVVSALSLISLASFCENLAEVQATELFQKLQKSFSR